MPHVRHLALVLFVALVFPAGCGSSRNAAMQKPVASSGTSSEEIWYQHGGARLAYTAVARPKQLNTGYGAVRDPVLYGQAPPLTQTPPKRRTKAKSAAGAPTVKPQPAASGAATRDPNCPPCPPTDTAAPQNAGTQARPAIAAPTQSSALSAPPPAAAGVPGNTGVPGAASLAAPSSPPRIPLPGMPAATPAPAAPDAPIR